MAKDSSYSIVCIDIVLFENQNYYLYSRVYSQRKEIKQGYKE